MILCIKRGKQLKTNHEIEKIKIIIKKMTPLRHWYFELKFFYSKIEFNLSSLRPKYIFFSDIESKFYEKK